MASVATTATTIADLLEQLGDIPANRVRLRPFPGTATEQDVIDLEIREKRLCELVDGVLVEKAMGFYESALTVRLILFLADFVKRQDLGVVAGEAGMLRLMPGLVRIPDISFVSWDRLPNRKIPRTPIPDLAVEVLSESNTPREMERKLGEYLSSGVRLVWYIDPKTRTARVYTDVDEVTLLDASHTLDGGDVLPGFSMPLAELLLEGN